MSQWKNFSDKELRCQHCGKENTSKAFITLMDKVQALREVYGKPLVITSAYRCPEHPIESAKAKAGQHSIAAVDLRVAGRDAYDVLSLALKMGFTGIGVSQKGASRFIHLDQRDAPTVWSY